MALRRSGAHVVSLFPLKTIISLNQSRNGFGRGLSESRRVLKSQHFFFKDRGHFTST